MKRRIFIKSTFTAGAAAALMPSMGFTNFSENDFPGNYQLFMLKNFEDEQEESPSIVTDRNGNVWIFTLRRLGYPQDKEVISAFRLNGDNWEEMNPVTPKAGHYEAPEAALTVCQFSTPKLTEEYASLTFRETKVKEHHENENFIPETSGHPKIEKEEKKYKMGFIASGDHTAMGVGVAALWVKKLDRKEILDALKERRCFATTGDKMIVDFRINESINGSVIKTDKAPALNIKVKGQRELEKIDVLRNSKVIKTYPVQGGSLKFDMIFSDEHYQNEKEICYYYIRATQKNNEIAWSSPIWVESVSS